MLSSVIRPTVSSIHFHADDSLGYWPLSRHSERSPAWWSSRSSYWILYYGFVAVLSNGKATADAFKSPKKTDDHPQVALGEMASQFPIPGGQFALAGRFTSPELGFAMGILFWYK